MTACRSMLWCNTQIPKCNHSVNSQTRENTFSKFQNFTIQVPKLYLRGVVVASSAAGNLLHWPWGVWGQEKKKNVSPVSPHSPTRSLKQDNEACGEGSNQLKLYSRMAFPWDWMQTRATWTVLPSIFVRFLISFFPTSTMRTNAFCPLNKHFSWQGFEFSLISVPYLIRRKGNRFLKWL